MTAQEEGLHLSISYARKVNLGNYESADVFFAVTNIPVGASESEIAEALETGNAAFEQIRDHVIDQANAARVGGRGGDGTGR